MGRGQHWTKVDRCRPLTSKCDPRARWRLDDTMRGHHTSMFIQIVCEKCHRDELKAIDDLIILFGKRHNMTGAA